MSKTKYILLTVLLILFLGLVGWFSVFFSNKFGQTIIKDTEELSQILKERAKLILPEGFRIWGGIKVGNDSGYEVFAIEDTGPKGFSPARIITAPYYHQVIKIEFGKLVFFQDNVNETTEENPNSVTMARVQTLRIELGGKKIRVVEISSADNKIKVSVMGPDMEAHKEKQIVEHFVKQFQTTSK